MTKDDLSRTLAASRQAAAIATGFFLPFSTSGQAIAVSVFAVLALLTLDPGRFADTIRRPAAWLPAALCALIILGVLWSPQPFGVAAKWIGPYAKLLLIPLAMATAFSRRDVLRVAYGFLAGCLIVLTLSWAAFLWPTGPWTFFKSPGVPFKDNAVQSSCFALCAFGLAIGALHLWARDSRRAIALVVLSLLFFADIFLIYPSKTGVIAALAMLGLFGLHVGGWRRAALIVVIAAAVMGTAYAVSPQAQQRVADIIANFNAKKMQASNSEAVSTESRIDFWTKASEFVAQAPLLGHGTGSIQPMYQSLEATRPSPYGSATADPHNQTLHTVLQVGLVGGVLLWAMWLTHARLFLGRGIAQAMGQAIVLQNIIGGLFNSHISAVTQGMLYCTAVGMLGALVLRRAD